MTERTYTIPLRLEILKAPQKARTKKAVSALRNFIIKHTKKTDILLSNQLNEHMWKNGITNPPQKIKVIVSDFDGKTHVRLFGEAVPVKAEKVEEKKSKPSKKLAEKVAETAEKTEKVEQTQSAEKQSADKQTAKPAKKTAKVVEAQVSDVNSQ